MTEALHDRLAKLADRDAAIRLLRQAIGRESVTGGEGNFVDFLDGRMASLGLEPVREDFLPGRPNIRGERKGTGEGPRLLFVGHTDTVHVRGWSERWAGTERESPFAGAEVDGEIWGRGAGDLKAGICTALSALDLLDRAGLSLKGDVAFAFVGDEESGEPGMGVSAGIKDFSRRVVAGEIGRPDFAVYVEPTRLDVFSAQIGFFIAEVTVTGRSAYFGVPEQGVDALKAAHKVLSAIWSLSERLSARAEHPLIGRAFLLVTEIQAGGLIAVPGACRLSLIGKLLPGDSLDEAVDALEEAVRGAAGEGVGIDIAYPAGRDHRFGGSGTETDPGRPEVELLARAMAEAMPGRGAIKGAPYWSESPFLINTIGCPAVYCAPGDIANCHTLEERVNADEYMAGIVAFAVFIAGFCGVAEG